MLVTPHICLTGETETPESGSPVPPGNPYPAHFAPLDDAPFFVDWLSISQSFPQELPVIDAGFVQSVTTDGEIEWKVGRKLKLKGSFDSSLQICCDGHRVTLSGNVSRFERVDNLFGLSLGAAIRKASDVVGRFGLPPFTAGVACPVAVKTRHGMDVEMQWSGARIHRLDLTENFAAGSPEKARLYLAWLATQNVSGHLHRGTYPDGETVDWGRGSRRLYAKCYLKSSDLSRHHAPAELVDYCEQNGVLRYELTLKSTQLQTMGCQYLGGLHMGRLIELYADRRSVMSRADRPTDGLDDLPKHFRLTASDYLAGRDVVGRMSRASFHRHRRALLPFGIDIAVPSGVVPFRTRVQVIELARLPVPHWYEFDQRYAA